METFASLIKKKAWRDCQKKAAFQSLSKNKKEKYQSVSQKFENDHFFATRYKKYYCIILYFQIISFINIDNFLNTVFKLKIFELGAKNNSKLRLGLNVANVFLARNLNRGVYQPLGSETSSWIKEKLLFFIEIINKN